ncbi:hypothetical protein EDE11_101151 [Methylomonas methanica]|uniref:Uncharacterized protein n=1 Tax=Methylomonas methanica TaxID=421 RepID=A0ABY2CSG0_METMH|nr:hypothetical protein EDE11_101151 [Methylomonas methanica]
MRVKCALHSCWGIGRCKGFRQLFNNLENAEKIGRKLDGLFPFI